MNEEETTQAEGQSQQQPGGGRNDTLNNSSGGTNDVPTTTNIVKEVIDNMKDKVVANSPEKNNNVGRVGDANNLQETEVSGDDTHTTKSMGGAQSAIDETTANIFPPVTEEKKVQISQGAQNEEEDVSGANNENETNKSTTDAKTDMEVDEINNNTMDDSDSIAKPERRTSKRQRTPVNNNVEESAPKKAKMNEGESGTKTSAENEIVRGNVDSVQEWSEPTYRWIDEGVKSSTGDTTAAAPSAAAAAIEYEGVEIDFTNTKPTNNWTPPPPFIVRRGDVVLLSSGDTPWDTNDANNKEQQQQQQHNTPNKATREVLSIYNDPASRGAGLGALDPYIGVVERLWEEDSGGDASSKKKNKGGGDKSTDSSKMMMRTRWFFKKEELGGITGNLVIEGGRTNEDTTAKDELLTTLASQDLVLTDQSDVNVVSTIMGKAKVIKRKPLDNSDGDVEMADHPKGSFVCRYTLSLSQASAAGEDVSVKLVPCADGDGSNDGFNNKVVDSTDPTSTDDDGYTDDNRGNNNFTAAAFPMSPRRVISEGVSTVGKIQVGSNHQAEIPPQLDLQRKTSFRGLSNPPSQRIPIMVWDPATDEGEHVNEFLIDACSVLVNHLKENGLEPFHEENYVGSPNPTDEATKPREANIDCLLMELHDCRGDTSAAIKKITANPSKYMTFWDKKEKEKFDAGYRVYRDAIRMIAKTINDTKSCKDTVDYQYRFKYCENFRRFLRKKHEKAEEMMVAVEDRMLNEAMKADARSQEAAAETEVSSSEEDEVKVTLLSDNHDNGARDETKLTAVPPAAKNSGPVNNRIRTWFRTGGGGEDDVGATQQRRNKVCVLLTQVKEKVGEDAYDTLANSIKACNTVNNTDNVLSDVQNTAKEVLKSHPDLLKEFTMFLPASRRV